MTGLDRREKHPGYWSTSTWPVENGGNRRQKSTTGGLHAASGKADVVTRIDDRWHVMVIQRDKDEWYISGTMPAFTGQPPFGWVQRIDPDTLEPLADSGKLPCGEHVWCGAVLAHANGAIYNINGSYLHRLNAQTLETEIEFKMPADRSHNGLLALSDGHLLTKDLRLEGQGGAVLTRIDPHSLEIVGEQLVLPEGSMGRFAADSRPDGTDYVYVPGAEHLWRIAIAKETMSITDWQPRYRDAEGPWGLAWDSCLSDGYCWVMDCGDIVPIRRIHSVSPNGRFQENPPGNLSWRQPSPRSGAQRLHRISLNNPDDAASIEPFGTPGGGIIAPPVNVPEHHLAIAWDSINGGLAGIDTSGNDLSVAWTVNARPSMQPVVFPESGELVINDFTNAGSDDLIVVDVSTGELLDRVSTGSPIANGMFLSPGPDQSIFYCTTTRLTRVRWT